MNAKNLLLLLLLLFALVAPFLLALAALGGEFGKNGPVENEGRVVVLGNFTERSIIDIEQLQKWEAYKLKYHKQYQNPEEEYKRLMIYLDNIERINRHNVYHKMGVVGYGRQEDYFTDRTVEEIRRMHRYIPPID